MAQSDGASPDDCFPGDLNRIDLRPGDRFVLSTEQFLSEAAVDRIRDTWAAFFGDDGERPNLLILDGGMKLGVIRAED